MIQSIFLNSLPNLNVFLYNNIWYSHYLKAGSRQYTSFTIGLKLGTHLLISIKLAIQFQTFAELMTLANMVGFL